jgi:hypothetical protein
MPIATTIFCPRERARRIIALAVGALAAHATLSHEAIATHYHWKSATSGGFFDPAMWDPTWEHYPQYPATFFIGATGGAYTVSSTGALGRLILDSPDATLLLKGTTGYMDATDLQLQSGSLRVEGNARMWSNDDSTPLTVMNAATIHVANGASLYITQPYQPAIATFTHAPLGRLQIDGTMRLDQTWFKNDGGEFAGPGAIALYNSRISTREGVANSNATFLVRQRGSVLAGEGYVNANPAGQTILVQGNGEARDYAGRLHVDSGLRTSARS